MAGFGGRARIPENDGTVFVTGDNGGAFDMGAVAALTEVFLTATLPLTYKSSETEFPLTVVGVDSDIYRTSTDTWVENPIDHQEHLWEVNAQYERLSSSVDEILEVKVTNPDPGVTEFVLMARPLERTTAVTTTEFLINIQATVDSLQDIASGFGGYKFSFISSAALTNLTILSMKRISLINTRDLLVDIS